MDRRSDDVQKEGKVVFHTLDESGNIDFYDVEWPGGVIEENIPSQSLTVTKESHHRHPPKNKKDK